MSQHTPHTNNPLGEQAGTTAAAATPEQQAAAAHLAVSRRAAIAAMFALAGSAVLFGMPRQARAARATQQTLDALASAEEQLAATQSQLDTIAAEFQALSIEQDKTIGQIEDVQTEIDATQVEIDKKQDELEEKQDILSQRVASSYKNGANSTLALLLSSNTFDELISNAYYVEKVNDSDKKAIEDVHTVQQELEEQKSTLETQKTELETLKAQQAERLSEMQAKQDEVQSLLDGLSQDVKDLMAQRDAEYLASAAEEEAQRKAAEEAAKRPGGGTTYIPGDGQGSAGIAGSQQRIVAACHAVGSPGVGLCAMWVSQVFSYAGFPYVGGNANDMYNAYCTSSNKANLKVGMVVAVSTHPHTSSGRTYGHIGIYVGDNQVMDNVGFIRTISIDEWIAYYGSTVTPRWGWLGGWVLQ